MNRRIAIIIATDFCCWIPFIAICALHFLEVLDATPWYSLFSMIILPINSVINPFLYDDVFKVMLRAPFRYVTEITTNSAIYQSFIARFSTSGPEVIEMSDQVEVREGGTRSGEGDIVRTTEI